MTTVWSRQLAVAAALVAATSACTSGPEVVDFGAQPGESAPELPADSGLDVADADPPAEVPPRDARLFEGGWPEVAGFVAREAAQDRPTLVNIFASWCVPCRAEMPLLLEARDEHPEVTFLGIDHIDPRDAGEDFIEEFDVDFATIYDFDGDVAYRVGARGMPTTVAFDRDGRLAGRVIGELSPSSLEELLDSVT